MGTNRKKGFCLHQFINIFFLKNHGLTRQWNLNLIMISILKRIIFKIRKNTMNKIITFATCTKGHFCRSTVHFYRGGENTRIKEICVLQVMYCGIFLLGLKKCVKLRFQSIKIHCMEIAYQNVVLDLNHRLYFCTFN